MELPADFALRKVAPRPEAYGEKVVTVILGNFNPSIRKDIHCVNCGRIVCNYYSEVRIVIVGEMREVSRPVDIMCSRCHTIHRII